MHDDKLKSLDELLGCFEGQTREERLKSLVVYSRFRPDYVQTGKVYEGAVAGTVRFLTDRKKWKNAGSNKAARKARIERFEENGRQLRNILGRIADIRKLARRGVVQTEDFYNTVGVRRECKGIPHAYTHKRDNDHLDLFLNIASRLGYLDENNELLAEAEYADENDYFDHRRAVGVENEIEERVGKRSALVKRAKSVYAQGRYQEALGLYGQIIQRFPNSETAYFNAGRCLRELGRNEEALGMFKRVLNRFSGRSANEDMHTRVWSWISHTYHLMGNSKEAGKAIRKIERKGEHKEYTDWFDNTVYTAFVRAIRVMGDDQEGKDARFLALLDEGLTLEPMRGDLLWLKGRAQEARGETDAAIETYEHAGGQYATDGYYRGDMKFWDHRRKADAIMRASRLLLGPEQEPVFAEGVFLEGELERLASVEGLIQKGATALQDNKWKKARTAYRAAVELDPHNVQAHLGVAKGWEGSGNKKDARVRYDTVLKIDGSCVEALYGAGVLHYEAGNTAIAARRLNKVLEELQRYRDDLPIELEARKILDDVVKPAYQDAMGAIGKKDYATARKKVDLAKKYHPTSNDVYYLEGVLLTHEGNHDEARNLFWKAIRAKGNFKDAESRDKAFFSMVRYLHKEKGTEEAYNAITWVHEEDDCSEGVRTLSSELSEELSTQRKGGRR